MIQRSDVQNVISMIPPDALITVGIRVRQNEDTYSASVSWLARRMRNNQSNLLVQQAMMSEQTLSTFEVFRQGQASVPGTGDRLIDPDGFTWQIRSVTSKYFDQVHQLICVRTG